MRGWATIRFHFKIGGRFDSALVPTGPAGEAPDSWLLAIEKIYRCAIKLVIGLKVRRNQPQ